MKLISIFCILFSTSAFALLENNSNSNIPRASDGTPIISIGCPIIAGTNPPVRFEEPWCNPNSTGNSTLGQLHNVTYGVSYAGNPLAASMGQNLAFIPPSTSKGGGLFGIGEGYAGIAVNKTNELMDHSRNWVAQKEQQIQAAKQQPMNTQRLSVAITDLFNVPIDQLITTERPPTQVIDPTQIPDLQSVPYTFQSPPSEFRDSVERLYKDLYKIQPQFGKGKKAREFGLFAVEEADQSYAQGNIDDAGFYKELGKEFLDIAVGLDPVTGFGRSAYELFAGKNLITGVELSNVERSLALVGVLSLGTESSITRISQGLLRIGTRAGYLISPRAMAALPEIAQNAQKIIRSAVEIGIQHGTPVIEFLRTQTGNVWARVQFTGSTVTEYGYKFFRRDVAVRNPLPSDGYFARIMPRHFAERLQRGEAGLARLGEDTLGRPINEAFITAYEDLSQHRTHEGIARRLALFSDEAGTQLIRLNEHDVIVKFRFNHDIFRNIRSPIEVLDSPRLRGFVPRGLTGGGAREWLIDVDAVQQGIIDTTSIVIEEILR